MSEATAPTTAPSAEDRAPRHVAIIMDGNGRWAAARGLPRTAGHRRGVEALRKTVRAAGELGIQIPTIFSFSYGARQEIARAMRGIAEDVAHGRLTPDAVTAELVASRLDAPDLPDPDVIIRTSGEQRLSNFLLWQAAYSELVFVPIYWPDFDRAALEGAIAEYRQRERRFGGLVAQTGS